ncbi:MAG: phosphate ABC transporter substrate-binding protein PstS [Prolixibacteraceae bacterium]|nr:phosphate ABC transporter substrate-binding protein PstS [Prolixibacteraceae bacterium]
MKLAIPLLLVIFVLASCQSSNKNKESKELSVSSVNLAAAGATFPMPFYNMVFGKYKESYGTNVTYGGIGSGGGIRSLADKVVDFGATDAYLEDDKLAEMNGEVVHIPTCLGAVVIAYNLPGVDGLKLSNSLLEKIFLGEITKWNDKEIVSLNPGLNLPASAISVIYRSDGSGTTHIFSDYMSKISSKWAEKVGVGKSLNWPVGMGAKGNPGVAGTISATAGTIGYIGSEYSFAMKIQTALVQNSSGNYVEPSIASISAAAKGDLPDDTRIMVTNSSAPDAYPISGFTWIILYKEQAYSNRTKEQAYATVKLLDWLISPEAQGEAEKVHYAPIPETAVEKAKKILKGITFEGQPLL